MQGDEQEHLPGDFIAGGSVFDGDWQVSAIVEATEVGRHNFMSRSVRLGQRRPANLQHHTTAQLEKLPSIKVGPTALAWPTTLTLTYI